jgi:hypothetical protein
MIEIISMRSKTVYAGCNLLKNQRTGPWSVPRFWNIKRWRIA